MEIRQVKEDELMDILHLEKEYTKNPETFEEIQERFSKFPELFIACYDDWKLVGEISGYIMDHKVIIKSIAVESDYQKKGIGKNLLEEFEKQAKEYSNVISVAAAEGYVELFYQKLGYKPAQFLVQIKKENLLENYQDLPYDIINERDEGDFHFVYIYNEKYNPILRDKIKKDFNAKEVNFIFEKRFEQ